jgi:TonB family protein
VEVHFGRDDKEMRHAKKITAAFALRILLALGTLVILPGNVDAGPPCEAVNPTSGPSDASIDNNVLVQVRIDKSGVIRDMKVVNGAPTLSAAAIKAVKRWKYKPASWAIGSPNERQTFLSVTLVKGAAPKVQEVALGVSSCIPAPARVRVSQIAMQGFLIHRVDPAYPPEALAKHPEGIVVMKITIDKEGSVYKAEPVSGPAELVLAAVAAVKQWKYQPYLLNGEMVEVETTADVGFTP